MEYELAAEGKLNYCIKDLCGDPSSLGELHGMVIPENWIESELWNKGYSWHFSKDIPKEELIWTRLKNQTAK